MMASSYQRIFPRRINKEFIGVASRFNQQKQRRKTEEERKKSLQSSFLYTEHQDKQLQRTIYCKSVELNRLQSSRLRKLEEIKAKEQLKELRQYQLELLKQRNNKLREGNKKKIENARTRLATVNHQGWAQLKTTIKNQTESLKKRLDQKLKSKSKQCSIIRERESIGLQKVDAFHKRKNSQNLEAYLQRIKLENRIKKEHEDKVRKIKKDLVKTNKSVSLKQNYLNCLDEEINKFRTDIRLLNKTRFVGQLVSEEEQNKKNSRIAFATMYKKDPNKS